MSKILRKAAQIFGSTAGFQEIAEFGSLAAASPTFTTDPDVIQGLSNYLDGWFSAVLGGNSPAIEDMNALCYLYAYQLAYLMQTGVPEWNATTPYYKGSRASDSNGVVYVSITDANLNNALTDVANWSIQPSFSKQSQLDNISIVTSVAANALTISLKTKSGANPSAVSPAQLSFRNSTLATGDYSIVNSIAATSIVIPSGADLGHVSGADQYVWVWALNNAGTIELAISGSRYFEEGNLHTTTSISAGSTDWHTLYSTTARTSKAIRLLGRVKVNEVTAGTWASNAIGIELFQGKMPENTTEFTITPITIGATVTPPTKPTVVTNDLFRYRRVGQYLEMDYNLFFAATLGGADGVGVYLFPIPNSLTVDLTMTAINTGGAIGCGSGFLNEASGSLINPKLGFPFLYDTGNLALASVDDVGGFAFLDNTIALFSSRPNGGLYFQARIPIQNFRSY